MPVRFLFAEFHCFSDSLLLLPFIFAGSRFLDVRICCFNLSFVILNVESLGVDLLDKRSNLFPQFAFVD